MMSASYVAKELLGPLVDVDLEPLHRTAEPAAPVGDGFAGHVSLVLGLCEASKPGHLDRRVFPAGYLVGSANHLAWDAAEIETNGAAVAVGSTELVVLVEPRQGLGLVDHVALLSHVPHGVRRQNLQRQKTE